MTQRMAGTLAAASRLSAADAAMAARMAVVALALPVLHRCLSLPSLMRLLDSRRQARSSVDPERQVRLARGVLSRRIGPLQPGCFRQSLILFHGLRRCGHPARIVFGVTENGDVLDGHSWIELDGEPFAEKDDPRGAFKVAYSYPQALPSPEDDS